MTVTIGTVPYLNARPLVRWFYDTEEGRESGIRIIEAVPSALATQLENGDVAAALVSSIELFRKPGWTHAPGIGVVAEGPVLSVRMLSRVPIPEIRRVALDTSSLTSVTLLKILLAERYGLIPQYAPLPPDLTKMLAEADAALLIGDKGYREYDPSLHVLDLGAAWQEWTRLPFVYAAWVGHPESLTPKLCAALTTAKEWGKAHLSEIAEREYASLNETYKRTHYYLTQIMRYDVGKREEQALALFGATAARHGLVSQSREEARLGG